jgi:hypothetical protein
MKAAPDAIAPPSYSFISRKLNMMKRADLVSGNQHINLVTVCQMSNHLVFQVDAIITGSQYQIPTQ